jgi:hypothetical protein
MSGIRIPVLPKQSFEYKFLGAGVTKEVTLFRALNLMSFKSARLIVRVHDVQHAGNGSFKVNVYTTAPSAYDSLEFSATSPTLECTVDSGSAAGDLEVDTDSDIAPFVKVVVVIKQDTVSAQALYAVLSADLIVRDS